MLFMLLNHFKIKTFIKKILINAGLLLQDFSKFKLLKLKNDFECQNFEMFEKLVYYFDKGPSIEDVGQFLRFLTPTLLRWQFFPTIRWQILDPFPLKMPTS